MADQFVVLDPGDRTIYTAEQNSSFVSSNTSGIDFTNDNLIGEIYYSSMAEAWLYSMGTVSYVDGAAKLSYMTSNDGINWSEKTFDGPRSDDTSVTSSRFFSANGYFWVFISYDGAAGYFFYSSDGVNWIQALLSTGSLKSIERTVGASYLSIAEHPTDNYFIASAKNDLGQEGLFQISSEGDKRGVLPVAGFEHIVYLNDRFYSWSKGGSKFYITNNGTGSFIEAGSSVAMPGDKSNLRDSRAISGNGYIAVVPAKSIADYDSDTVYISNSDMTSWTSASLPATGSSKLYYFSNIFYVKIGNSYYRTNSFDNFNLDLTTENFVTGAGVGETLVEGGIPNLVAGVTPYIQNQGGQFTIVGAKVSATNYITYNSFLGYDIDYKIDDLNGDWQPLYAGKSNTVVQTLSKGFIKDAAMSYRVRAVFTNETKETIVTNGSLNLTRYDVNSSNGFIVDNLVWDYVKNRIKLKFSLPNPFPPGFTTRVFYRVTDLDTQKILGENFSSGQAEGFIATVTPASTFPYEAHAENNIQIFIPTPKDSGSKGIKIQFGYSSGGSLTAPGSEGELLGDKGILYFYPDSSDLPAGPVWEENTSETSGIGQEVTGPAEPEPGDEGEPDDEGPGVTGDDEDENYNEDESISMSPIDESDDSISFVDGDGDPVATGQLPPGTPPNALVTLRKEGDILTLIHDGEIIITYTIDPAKFPSLVNSKGWLGFTDDTTGEPVPVPEGSTVSLLPEGGSLYELFPMDEERPLGYHPLYYQYGDREQGYTILVYEDDSVAGIVEPTTDQLKEAVRFYRGGGKYAIDLSEAQRIANAGLGRWIKVIR